MGKYDDIIDLPHHVSKKHPQMPALDRAAQFSPFAALTGHHAMIEETERLTESRVELDENEQEEIALWLRMIKERIRTKPEAVITFFVPDAQKTGGSCRTVSGVVKKVDGYEKQVFMEDGTVIPMEDIYAVEGEFFEV